jgi:predicted NBD/HSP70 family sugar kinase
MRRCAPLIRVQNERIMIPTLSDAERFRLRREVVVSLLRSPGSAVELSKKLDVAVGDMASLLSALSAEGLIVQDEPSSTSSSIRLNPDSAYGFGVDVGGTKVSGALVNLKGEILAQREERTDVRGGDHVFDQIARLAHALADGSASKLKGSVVGLPCAIHPKTGEIALAPNIASLNGLNARIELAKRLPGVIAVENDVNLAAVAEHDRGAASACSNMAFLALGTGTGLGLIINGELVRGAGGSAGEVGFLPIGCDLDTPEALERGAFENAAGSQRMLSDYRRRSGARVATVRKIFDRHLGGDPHASAVLEETGRLVALSIVALHAILDLELIVLGGSIGVREELVNIITKQIRRHFHAPIEVAVSKLGNQAGLIGASVSAHRTLLQSMFGKPAAGGNDTPEQQDLQRSVSNLSSFGEAPA